LTTKARLLGSGGWLPADGREICCLYLRKDDRALLLDAGTGMRRLVTDPDLLEGVDRLDVVLTHFHLDHVSGLVALPALRLPVGLWAAGRALAGVPSVDLLHRLLDPPFLLNEPAELSQLVVEVHELEPGSASIGPFDLETRVQPRHPQRTLGIKVEGALVYCTDTAYDEATIEFARGARVLVHEGFYAEESRDDNGHTAAGDAARLAAAAGVERLVLIHLHPLADEAKLLDFARRHFAASEVGHDGLRIELGENAPRS
jgi:ribonuclease BN (tRNA processing enzyme)